MHVSNLLGLRRVTLNGNEKLGDSGLMDICEVLQDDIWMKALDVQLCGLTDIIGRKFVELLKRNVILEVVDLRLNKTIGLDTMERIVKLLGEVMQFF